ncbi:MAG: DUF58 domain-containing protein [Anaerolineae bacterium]|nr:DUF58 domain-containing protein [Anaerolineae bacterium]
MSNRRNAVYLLLITSLVIGLITGRSFFFNLAAIFSGLLFVTFWWSWYSVRWIRIERKTRARRAQVGRTVLEHFAIHNRTLIPKLWLEIRDHSTLPGHKASHVVPYLTAKRRYQWNTETMCLLRGEYKLGPLTIISGDPFGLFVVSRKLEAVSHILVYPQTVPITRIDLPIGILSGGDARRQRTFHVTTNAVGIRDYAPGDSFNRIHWPSSARKDQLLVKEFELDPLVDIWLFPDFSLTSLAESVELNRDEVTGNIIPTNKEIPPSTEEYIVAIAASMAKCFIDSERSLGYSAYSPHREFMQPERGSRQLSRILQSLAMAHNTSNYSLSQMLSLEAHYFSRGTTLVIITASIDEAWITELQLLLRRGIRSMCVLVDPSSFVAGSSMERVSGLLRIARIPTIIIRQDDNLASVLQGQVI